MQPSSAPGCREGDHPARPSCGGWDEEIQSPVQPWAGCKGGDGVCSWDDEVASKLCPMRVPSASLAIRIMGPAACPAVDAPAAGLEAPGRAGE